MKKSLCLILSLCFCFCAAACGKKPEKRPQTVPVTQSSEEISNWESALSSEASDTEGFAWSVSDDGTLTVSGKGHMPYQGDMPWQSELDKIKAAVIETGIDTICFSAFDGCKSLERVSIADSVTKIDSYAFAECTKLTSVSIPDSVTEIGDSAFYGCVNLEAVTIGTGLAKLGNEQSVYEVFQGCEKLKEINVAEENSVFSSADGVLFNKDRSKLVMHPAGRSAAVYEIPDGVTSIGDFAFINCGKLEYVKIPDSVTEIGICAFEECASLTSISMPDKVYEVKNRTFFGCTALTSVNFGSTLTLIGENAFSYCHNLESVKLPDRLEEIKMRAFSYSGLTEVSLPKSVDYVDPLAFEHCNKLVNYKVESGNTYLYALDGVLFRKDVPHLMLYPIGRDDENYTVPEGTASIERNAFAGCEDIVSVVMPEGLKDIGEYAFEDCSSLASITLPQGVLYIHRAAFSDCTALANLVIPNSVTEIRSDAFKNCNALRYVYYNGTKEEWLQLWNEMQDNDLGEKQENFGIDASKTNIIFVG